MKPFKDLPLGRKALILGTVPAVCAVLMLAVASLTATYIRSRRNTVVDLQAQAAIVADSVASAVAFGYHDVVETTLRTFDRRPTVEIACVYDAAGQLFAGRSRAGNRNSCAASLAALRTARPDRLLIEQPIASPQDAKQVGTVVLRGNLSRFYTWMVTQAAAITVALLGGMLVGFVLTSRLKRAISEPVLDLARTADAVTASRDYSLRAVKSTGDEVGGLVESFNSMLDELQRQNDTLTVEIAERKRAEELKDAFLAAVSHELRTPLNAILGRVQLLRLMKPTGERLERSLESLERNARSQARLVEDLLDVSRIVSGKFQLRMGVVDLRKIVELAVEAASPLASDRSIALTAETPETPCLVSGDEDRLQQMVLNLLSNAMKFGGGAPVSVTLEADAPGHTYAISVRDQGIGIAPEFLPNVFDRFRQADISMTRQHGGLGLGLAIVKEVAELHGGSVSAHSDGIGAGATFTIRLPQLLADTLPAASRVSEPAPLGADRALHGFRVLVVDDEPDGLEIAATALSAAGAEVGTAGNGPDAIAMWEAERYDALVSDLAMPRMDGFQVLDHIVALDRAIGRRPAAVALTAYASNEHRERTLLAGFHAHLAKPYNTTDLISAVSEALRTRAKSSASMF